MIGIARQLLGPKSLYWWRRGLAIGGWIVAAEFFADAVYRPPLAQADYYADLGAAFFSLFTGSLLWMAADFETLLERVRHLEERGLESSQVLGVSRMNRQRRVQQIAMLCFALGIGLSLLAWTRIGTALIPRTARPFIEGAAFFVLTLAIHIRVLGELFAVRERVERLEKRDSSS